MTDPSLFWRGFVVAFVIELAVLVLVVSFLWLVGVV